VAEGAEALIGGHAIEGFGDGTFYAPTILIGVDQGMEAARAEIFGPVLTVQTFEDEEEALALADHPEFDLASGVYTRDLSRALRMVRSLEAGTVWINRYGDRTTSSCRRAATRVQASARTWDGKPMRPISAPNQC
jgi:aldehyde dehydrogenase (NAD+)